MGVRFWALSSTYIYIIFHYLQSAFSHCEFLTVLTATDVDVANTTHMTTKAHQGQ
jgi:hypothetical protein